MTNHSKSKQKSINNKNKGKVDKRFKRGLIIAIIGFIPFSAVWAYINRDQSTGSIVATLLVAAMAVACGLWLVYRLNANR